MKVRLDVRHTSYGRFDFLVCDWSLQNGSRFAGEKTESKEFVMSDLSKWIVHVFPSMYFAIVLFDCYHTSFN